MDQAVARLLLTLPSDQQVSLPVPRQACLGLTRTVVFLAGRLAGAGFRASESDSADDWIDRCWQDAAGNPAVALWLLAAERQAGGSTTWGAAGQRQIRQWLDRLRADLVTPMQGPSLSRLQIAKPLTGSCWSDLLGQHWLPVGPAAEGPAVRAVAGDLLAAVERWAADSPPQTSTATGATALELVADPVAVLLDEVLATAAAVESLAADAAARVATARLDAIRELAYGAGHEINNPLANIAARAQALLPDETDPERRRRLATIVDQAFRARDMIGGLMIFARPPRPQPAAVGIAELVTAVVASVATTAEQQGVRITLNPLPDSSAVLVDRSQIEESVRAVLLNAIEAISGGGSVIIEAAADDQPEGRCCLLKVTDNGTGMSQETVERMFDPFFSGREAGRGVGLGLSKALRLIDANGGRIAVASRPRQGTTVTIRLPLATDGR